MAYRAPAGMNLKQPVTDPRLATALSTATGMQWSASPLCPGREGAQTTYAGHSVRVYRDPAADTRRRASLVHPRRLDTRIAHPAGSRYTRTE